MPRDANGNYTLPSGNPVVTNTLISSTWANDTMSDLANEMQDSLSRSGKGGFTAPVGIVDKSGSIPGLNFAAEPTSGFKRENNEDLRMQVTGTDVWQATKDGVKVITPNSGGLLKSPVVEEAGEKVLRGESGVTVLWFYLDTPPPGWNLLEPDANVRELVIGPSGAGQGGQVGGNSDPTALNTSVSTTVTVNLPAATGNHTLSQAQVPNTGEVVTNKEPEYRFSNAQTPSPVDAIPITGLGPAGGGGAHNHTIGGTAAGSGTGSIATITPRYARGILATLD